MVVDSEWECVEVLQLRKPDIHSRRIQKIIDEMEYENNERENY